MESLLAKFDEDRARRRGQGAACPCCCRSRSTRPTTTCCPTDVEAGARQLRAGAVRAADAASASSGTAPSARAASRSPTRSSRPSPRRSPTCRRCRAMSLRFAEWVARYTLAPLGMVVRMMMGSPGRVRAGEAALRRHAQSKVRADPPRMTPARKRALEIAADGADPRQERAGRGSATARPASSTAWSRPAPWSRWRSPSGACPRPTRPIAHVDFGRAQAARRARHARRRRCAAPSPSRCSTASPAPARPRSTSRPWRARWRRAARR